MKYRLFSKNPALSRQYLSLSRNQDDEKGFSYFQNDTAAIKLSAWVVLSAERVIIASFRTVSHLVVLCFMLSSGSTFPERIGKMLAKLLSI